MVLKNMLKNPNIFGEEDPPVLQGTQNMAVGGKTRTFIQIRPKLD
jgi:hypothetical protein